MISPQEDYRRNAALHIPFHNGQGNFQNRPDSRLDLFEHVNTWRMEQSAIIDECFSASSPKPLFNNQESVWRKLKQNAAWGVGKYLTWDDEALDALFNKDHGLRKQHQHQISSENHRRTHLSRARVYGPPSWKDRVMQHML